MTKGRPLLDQVVKMRCKHYQQRLVEAINKLVEKRRIMKMRKTNLDIFKKRMSSDVYNINPLQEKMEDSSQPRFKSRQLASSYDLMNS